MQGGSEDSGGSMETITESKVNEKRTNCKSAEVIERKTRKVAITGRPWGSRNREKHAKQRDDVEAALLATANSLVEQARKTPEPQKTEQLSSKFAKWCVKYVQDHSFRHIAIAKLPAPFHCLSNLCMESSLDLPASNV